MGLHHCTEQLWSNSSVQWSGQMRHRHPVAAVDKGQGWVLFTINLGLGIGGYRQGRLGDGQRATHIAEGVVVVHASRAADRVWAYITVLNSCGRTARFSGQVRCAITCRDPKVKAAFILP